MANVTEIFPTNKSNININLDISSEEVSIKVFGSDIIIESKSETFIILYGAVFVSLGNSLTIQDSTNKQFSLSELLYSSKTEYESIDDKVVDSDKVDNIIVKSKSNSDKEADITEGLTEVTYNKAEVDELIEDAIAEVKNFKENINTESENLVTAKSLEQIDNEINSNTSNKDQTTTAQEVDFTNKYEQPPIEENVNSFNQTEDESITIDVGSLIPEFSLNAESDSGIVGDDRTNNINPTVSGNFITNSTIELTVTKDSNTTNYSVEVGDDGTWQQEIALDNNDGTYAISVAYTDTNSTTHTYSDNIVLDTVIALPTVSIALASDSGTTGDSTTNNITPTINGSAEANATISVALGSTVIGTTTASSDGVWQFSIPSNNALSSGNNSLNVTATDISNNISGVTTINIIVDNTSPSIPIVSTIGFDGNEASLVELNKGVHILKGTAEALSQIELSIEGTLIGTREVSATGSWTFDLDTNSLDGENIISIVARDDADNVSVPYTDTISIVGTINSPSISLSSDSDTGFRINETMNLTPTYEGITEIGATVRLFRDNSQTSFAEITADNQGMWTYTEVSGLAEGSHAISAIAVFGNSISNESILNFVVDTTPPTGLIINNSSSIIDIFGNDSIEITGTGETPGNHFYYQILDSSNTIINTNKDDGTVRIIETDGTWGFSIEPNIFLGNGSYSVEVVEIDGAGNETDINIPSIALNVNQITFEIQSAGNDNTPDFAIEGPTNVRIEVSITDANNQVVYTLDTVKNSDAIYIFTPDYTDTNGTFVTYIDGDYSIVVNTTDNNTNQTRDFSDNFTIDTIAPDVATDITIASGSLGLTANLAIDDTPEITGTAEANSIISLVLGANTYTTTTNNSGVWSLTISDSLANSNTYTADITVTDIFDNSSPAQAYDFSVQVHTVADIIKDNISLNAGNIVFPDYTNNPIFNGTGASINTTITAILNGADVGSAIVVNDGTWELTIDSSVTDGQRDIQLVARDEYGNTSNTVDFPIVIDTQVPTKPSFSINSNIISGTVNNDDSAAFAIITVDNAGTIDTFISVIGTNGGWSFISNNLSNNDIVSIQIQDKAGNLSDESDTITVTGLNTKELTTDTVADLLITSKDYGIDQHYDFTAVLEDSASSLSINSVSLNGISLAINNPSVNKNNEQASFDLGEVLGQKNNELQNGNYEIILVAQDAIGNKTNYIHNVEILLENNTGIISLLGDDNNIDGNFVASNTPTILGTSAIGENIIVLNASNNKSIATNIDSNGNWSVQIQDIINENTLTTLNIISSGYGNENTSNAFTLIYDDSAVT